VHRPERGWVREIREALGMTSRQLAARMGCSQPAVVQLERSERKGGIRLETLERCAAALDCDLVYGLVPRTSLDDTVRTRARDLARRVRRSITGDQVEENDASIDSLADAFLAGGRLWDEPDADRARSTTVSDTNVRFLGSSGD